MHSKSEQRSLTLKKSAILGPQRWGYEWLPLSWLCLKSTNDIYLIAIMHPIFCEWESQAFSHHQLHGENTKRIPPPPTAWQKYQTHSPTTHCMAKITSIPHHPLHGINSIYDRIFFINFLNQYSRNVLFWNENSKSTWIRVRLKIKNITVMQIFRSEHIFFFNRQQTLNPVNVLC